MLDAIPSRTAMATAFIRAAHVHIDDSPPVFDDSVAYQLLPGYQRRFIRRLATLAPTWLRRYRQSRSGLTAMRAQVVVRARYTEDALGQARACGISRYIVLAAGLDTFALRQHEPTIPVIEIDHPATQRWKCELMVKRNLPQPAQLQYQPIDFEKESLADVFIEHSKPDFISWLGATYYLTRDAISSTLTTLSKRTRPGTQLVFDYWSEPAVLDTSSPLLLGTRIAVALQQEPMKSFFDAHQIQELATSCGWRIHENCSAKQQNQRYLANRRDGLTVPSFANLLHLVH